MRTMENMIDAAIEAATKCPNISREGLVQNIVNRIHVALIAAVYAGHIESNESVKIKFNGVGADSYQHREEYMNYAANFVFPYDNEGKIASDAVFNEVSNYMWDKYSTPIRIMEEEYTPTCLYGYVDCVYDPAYIKANYPEWYEDLGCPTTCENCLAGERYDDEDK